MLRTPARPSQGSPAELSPWPGNFPLSDIPWRGVAPRCSLVAQRVEHELAPHLGAGNRKAGVTSSEPYPAFTPTVTRAVAPVTQLGEPGGDGGGTAEDSFDGVGPIRAGGGAGRVYSESNLSCSHQLRKILFVVDGQSPFVKHYFGGALDQLLGRTDGLGGVVVFDGPSDAVEVFTDGSRVSEPGEHSLSKDYHRTAGDPAVFEPIAVTLE